jgi:hypothetical protein
MPRRLNNIGPKRRHRFRGEFVRFGSKPGWAGTDVTVLLRRICLVPEVEQVADHLWFNWTRGFQRLGDLVAGDLIEFDARAVKYEKGYRGPDLVRQSENPPRTGWKLSHPSRIEKVA